MGVLTFIVMAKLYELTQKESQFLYFYVTIEYPEGCMYNYISTRDFMHTLTDLQQPVVPRKKIVVPENESVCML